MRIRSPAAFLLAAALVPTSLAICRGDEVPAPLPTVSELDRRIGNPVDPSALEELRPELDLATTEIAVRLARALGRAGGAAAARELAGLVRHPDERVRIVALEAAAHVGLRHEPLARAAREALATAGEEERVASAALLGRLGDGRDVPLLLGRLDGAGATAAERRAVFLALAELGKVARHDSSERWRAWWNVLETRDRPQVAAGLEALAESAPERIDLHRAVVHHFGWLDLETVRETARAWLVQPNPALRAEACRLVRAFRLADLAEALSSARSFDMQRAYQAEADAALQELGLLPPSAAPESEATRPDPPR